VFSLFARLRQLILPGTAQPNDPAIILGPDLPPCMQARYSSAIFFRPPNTASAPLTAPLWFLGHVKNPFSEQVDEGYALYDQQSPPVVCGFIVYRTRLAPHSGLSGNLNPIEVAGSLFAQGSAGFLPTTTPTVIQFGGTGFLGPNVAGMQVAFGDAANTPLQSEVSFDGVSAARGLRAWVASNVNTAAIGAEAVVLTSPSMTFYKGRAYEITWSQHSIAAGAGTSAVFVIRRNNLAGGNLAPDNWFQVATGAAETDCRGRVIITGNPASDITDNLVLTMAGFGSNVTGLASATHPRFFQVNDCGAASDFPNTLSIF